MEQDMMDTYNAFAPSEAEVATYKEKLDNSKAEQKNLFLIIFQVNIKLIVLTRGKRLYNTLVGVKFCVVLNVWFSGSLRA